MSLGIAFWSVVWCVMALAFVFAWLFIVKGCESMDSGTMLDSNQLDDFHKSDSSHDSSSSH